MVRIILISAISLVWLAFGCPSWMADDTLTLCQRALCYSLFHGNIFHLAVNALAIWYTFTPKRNCVPVLIASYIIAVLVYPLNPRPIVGISNIVFAAAGLHTPPLRSAWWKQTNTHIYLGTMALMLLLPQISAITHIASFATGVLCAILVRQYKSVNAYAGRYLR